MKKHNDGRKEKQRLYCEENKTCFSVILERQLKKTGRNKDYPGLTLFSQGFDCETNIVLSDNLRITNSSVSKMGNQCNYVIRSLILNITGMLAAP